MLNHVEISTGWRGVLGAALSELTGNGMGGLARAVLYPRLGGHPCTGLRGAARELRMGSLAKRRRSTREWLQSAPD